jgi:hypothetical protein
MVLRRLRRLAAASGVLVLLAGVPSAAWAADGLFEVAKISVDVTAADAVAARTIGMEEAGARAVKTVLQRLVPAQEMLPELAKEDVEALVNGVSIRKEQNSTTRYIATLDVSVNEQGIKQLLQQLNIPYSETRAPSISILPVMLAKGGLDAEGGEAWRQAWEDLDLAHSVTPATILRARPELSLESIKAVLSGDGPALEAMQADYGYGPLVIAVGEVSGGKFVTRLAGADGVGALDYGQSDKLGSDANATRREAAALAFAVIENRWKTSQSGDQPTTEVNYQEGAPAAPAAEGDQAPKTEVPRMVVAQVEFSGLKDWQEIRGRLMNVAGIQALEVNSLSARGASITFDYAGSLGKLQQTLGENGFLFDDKDGTFVLRSR